MLLERRGRLLCVAEHIRGFRWTSHPFMVGHRIRTSTSWTRSRRRRDHQIASSSSAVTRISSCLTFI